jgi:alpha-tubulin suppressor-like RCC1 family protein
MKKRRSTNLACFSVFLAILAGCPLQVEIEKEPDGTTPGLGPRIAILLKGQTIPCGGVVDAFIGTAPGSPAVVVFSIQNIGDATLDLVEAEPLRIDGPDAGLFGVDQPPGSLQLLPAESTSFSITFSPDTTGIRTAFLTICSNDPTQGEFLLTLTNVPSRGHMISGGWYHSVAVTYSGEVWTWGCNDFGRLGDGTTTARTEPVLVPELAGIVSVAAGGEHTMALKSDGSVWAWGHNSCGEVGDGTCVQRNSPVQVIGLSSVIAIAAGGHHSVALKADGTVWSWGLGTGRTTPGAVPGLGGITAISSGGGWFTLALGSDKTVWAWGQNEHGQLGDGTTTSRYAPVQVSGLVDVRTIAAGMDHSTAVKADGTVWVWGQPDGQLVPMHVAGISQVTATTGGRVSMALCCDGTVWKLDVWSGVTRIDELSGIVGIAGGEDHWIALGSDGAMFAWGDDYWGQLGGGVRGYRSEPMQVSGISAVTAIATGDLHSLALDAAGKVWAWGANRLGQLGIGVFSNGPGMRGYCTPQAVVGSLEASSIGAGRELSFAPAPDGDFWAWGSTPFGICISPEPFALLSDVTATAASMRGMGTEIVTLKSDGTLWYYFTSTLQGQIAGLADIVSLDGYDGHTVLKTDGSVWVWDHGVEPAQVQGVSGVVSIAVGCGDHTVVATSEGSAWAWGSNDAGQVGDGTTVFRTSPVQVAGISNVIQVAAGSGYSLALKSDGTVWAWGRNAVGSLGDNSTLNRSTPVQVQGLTEVTGIRVCGYGSHSLALDSNGTVWAWGDNSYGQIGGGVSLYLETPAAVSGLLLW